MINKETLSLGVRLYRRWLSNKDNPTAWPPWRAWLSVNGCDLLAYVSTIHGKRGSQGAFLEEVEFWEQMGQERYERLKTAAQELLDSQHTTEIYLGNGMTTTSLPKYDEDKLKRLKELLE